MVLPNWREELALLRKEQELAGTASPVTPEKKVERSAPEPPPLPHRSPNTPLPSHEPSQGSSQIAPPRPPEKSFSDLTSGGRAPQERPRPADLPRRTPLPQNSAQTAEPAQRAQNTPLPPSPAAPPQRVQNTPLPPPEHTRMSEASRRELHVKVWEQEATMQYPQVHAEKAEPGPVAAVEKNPLASVAFGAREQTLEAEDLEAVNWQAPLGPVPASPPARAEQRPSIKEESRPPIREEQSRAVAEKSADDIEDLPTMRLAVPEAAQPGAQIKVERTSTPAPRKWAVLPTDEIEVEDLPTRPLAASPAGPVAPRGPQQPVGPQMQSEERRPESGPADNAASFAQRAANPISSPGTYGPASAPPPLGQAAEIAADPLASRGRPTNPNSSPGQSFNLASLPPLPPGPPGNTQLRPEMQGPQQPPTPFPDAFSPRPPQRPPSFAPASPQSIAANMSQPVAGADATAAQKPRGKRHTARLVMTVLLLLVVLVGGVGAWRNWDWVVQFVKPAPVTQPFQTYQNSTFGVSLDYQQRWSVSVDQAHSTIRFVDSSHTGQANLSMAAVSGQVGDYLNRQAAQIPLSGPKTAPAATFAGSSWQVLRGTGTQSGATYTIVLYAAQHNGHFYLLEFLAPQSAFENIEQNSFAHMRSSFSFV